MVIFKNSRTFIWPLLYPLYKPYTYRLINWILDMGKYGMYNGVLEEDKNPNTSCNPFYSHKLPIIYNVEKLGILLHYINLIISGRVYSYFKSWDKINIFNQRKLWACAYYEYRIVFTNCSNYHDILNLCRLNPGVHNLSIPLSWSISQDWLPHQ